MKSIVFLLLILLGLGLQCPLHGDQEPRPSSPNVLVILTDDQDVTLGSLAAMPYLTGLMNESGVTFNNMFAAILGGHDLSL